MNLFLHNGRVLYDAARTADCIHIEDGVVNAVGDIATVQQCVPTGCDRIDLGGRWILPGFIDSHVHILQVGTASKRIDLSGCSTKTALITALEEGLAERGASGTEWIMGVGYDDASWSGEVLTQGEIDILAERPLVVRRVCGHMALVNSSAHAIISGVHPDWLRAEDGWLTEEGALRIGTMLPLSDREIVAALNESGRVAFSYGITSVHDIINPDLLDRYREAGAMPRVTGYLYTEATSEEKLSQIVENGRDLMGDDEHLRINGLKVFMDGSVGARTAAFNEPYIDTDSTGELLLKAEDLVELWTYLPEDVDRQLMVHAIGDAAINEAVKALKLADDIRIRLEHMEFPTRDDLMLLHKFALDGRFGASMQPNFVGRWGGENGMYHTSLGEKRWRGNNPFMTVMELAIPLAFGSDNMPMDPFFGITSAVNAPLESQRLGVEEAVFAYTGGGALIEGAGWKGMLLPGMCADMVVLDRGPIAAMTRDSVVATLLDGAVVHERDIGSLF